MTNLLIHEWDNALAERAALFGADEGTTIRQHSAHWTATLSACSVSVGLDVDSTHRCLVPSIRMGSSSGLPGDPMLALAVLRDAETTIHKAIGAYAALAGLRVWTDGAPCDSCSARSRATCAHCGGTGTRTLAHEGARP